MAKSLHVIAVVLLLASGAATAQDPAFSRFQSINPPSGYGNSQSFTLTYDVPPGVNINAVYFAATPAQFVSTLANTCAVIFEFASNSYRLINDAGNGWSAPLAPNSGSTNKSCTFNSAGAGVTRNANLVSVTFPIAFPADRAGLLRTFTNRSDSTVGTDFWYPAGSWTVPGTAVLNGPDVAEVRQESIGDFGYRFTNVFRHSGGASQQYLDYFLLLPLPNTVNFTAAGTCLVEYNRISNGVRLINDAGDNWIGPPEGVRVQPGTPPLVNSVCQVDVANMKVVTAGTDILITTPIALAPSFHGQPLGVFLQQQDMQGVWTDFRQMGRFISGLGTPQRQGPYWQGNPSQVHAVLTHTSGSIQPIDTAHFRVSASITGSPYCHVVYFRAANTLNLVNDAGTGFVSQTGITPGGGTLQNASCTVNGSNTTVVVGGNGSTLEFSIGLTTNEQTFSSPKYTFVNAFDNQGNVSHWWVGGFRVQ